MKRISWKAINAWIMFGLLLAPGLYLFGGYIGQLAGSHGEFMYAEPAIEGGIDYSVTYNGNTYKRTVYCPNNYIYISDDGEGSNLYLGTESPNSIQTLSNYWIYTAGEIQIIDEIPQSYQSWRDNGEKGGASYTADECYCWFYYNASSDVVTYWEFFGSTSLFWNFSWDDNASKYVEDVYDTAPDFSNMDLYDSSYFFFDEGLLNVYIGELTWTHPRNIPETQPNIQSAPAIEPNAQGNTEFQQGQFFSRNNFLKKWGDSVVSQDETWGFAPFKALIQYLDDNMLHFAPNGVQYGLMAYGYMYYALHIVLLDLVFYITSFLPRILKKLAERLEGGLD